MMSDGALPNNTFTTKGDEMGYHGDHQRKSAKPSTMLFSKLAKNLVQGAMCR